MFRKEKVTESTSTLEAQASDGGAEFSGGHDHDHEMELVADPGPVKRIVFGEAPGAAGSAPLPEPESQPPQELEFRRVTAAPAVREHSDSIYSIREGVDRISAPDPGFRGAPPRANLKAWRSSTVYRTEQGGEVRAHDGPAGKVYTLADGHRERRFTSSEVDRVIANVRLEETADAAASEPQAQESVPEESPTGRRRGLFGFRRGRKGEAAPSAPPEQEYQPQCGATTEEGLQCRNSARTGSKYCSSHHGFQPRTAQGILQARDTEPRFESSRDTLPGGGWDPAAQGSAQCTALTLGGRQCQNPIVAGSPYCGSHQGYEEPSAKDIVKSADTKPRWRGARDTKPAIRKKGKSARRRA